MSVILGQAAEKDIRSLEGTGFSPYINPPEPDGAGRSGLSALAESPEGSPSALSKLVTTYLAVLANERGSSPHTLRAYERELRAFVVYIVKNQGQDTQPS